MYTYVKSISLSREMGSGWTDVDLSNTLLRTLFNDYLKVYLTLHNNSLTTDVFVDLDSLKSQYYNFSGTLNDFLIFNNNNTLQTLPNLPTSDKKVVKYYEAIRCNYKAKLGLAGMDVPEGYPDDEKYDLELYRPKYTTDLSLLERTSLITVNGYVHDTVFNNNKLFIKDAGKTIKRSNFNHIGILSFLDVGNITRNKLKNLEVVTPIDGTKSKVYFSVDTDLTSKSVILVLGGYLVFPDNDIFWSNGDNSFVVDMNRIPYLERLYEANNYLDLSSLGLSVSSLDTDLINITEVNSEVILKNYFSLSNSFLLTVEIDKIVTNKVFIRHSNLPGKLTAYQEPILPLIVNYGKMAEYWKTCDHGYWDISIVDTFYRNFILSHQQFDSLVNVTDMLLPNLPYYNSHGYFLEISGFNI